MGLDVYMYKYSDFNKSKELEKIYEDYSNSLYDVLEEVPEEQQESAKKDVRQKCKDKAQELGLGEWGEDLNFKTRIEQDSVLHPEHYFKIGYFRSSYNGSGINSVLQSMGIPDLYDIFHKENDDYEFSPNWKLALEKVNEVIQLVKKDKGYRIETVSANMFAPDDVPTSPADAYKIFQEEAGKKRHKDFTDYSNKFGSFYLGKKGMEVRATIPGKDMWGRPCTFIVYQLKDGNKYILESLEIVKETIEFVLADEHPENFYLSWSA